MCVGGGGALLSVMVTLLQTDEPTGGCLAVIVILVVLFIQIYVVRHQTTLLYLQAVWCRAFVKESKSLPTRSTVPFTCNSVLFFFFFCCCSISFSSTRSSCGAF